MAAVNLPVSFSAQKTPIKVHKKVLTYSNVARFAVCRMDKYYKNIAFLVLYGLSDLHGIAIKCATAAISFLRWIEIAV